MIFREWGRLVRLYEQEILSLIPDAHDLGGLTPEVLLEIASSPRFQEMAWRVAERMATHVAKVNAASWREAAAKSGRGRAIFTALKHELNGTATGEAVRAIVRENAALIRSLPIDLAQRTTLFIARERQKGRRAEDIERDLRLRLPDLTRSRIRLIARTEVGKSETAVTRVRAQNIGADWYQWQSSRDARVRKSHRLMDGVLVNWHEPPSPEALAKEKPVGAYAPGEIWLCRCLALPLISFGEVKWPARVFLAGKIQRMTLAEFTRAVGMPIAA